MNEREILEKTYTDFCDIYTYVTQEEEDGSEKQMKKKLYENIACAFSKKSMSDIKLEDSTSTVSQSYMLFLSDMIHVSEGFLIYVGDDFYEAGKGILYKNSHQEIPLLYMDKVQKYEC